MLLIASILLSTSSWVSAPSCPSAFSVLNTSVGAISDSTQLNVCVSRAVMVKGVSGSLNLIVGTKSSTAPQCLVYPNGLSFDLTYSLLSSGHVGCWSLYPPSQRVAVINVGRPNQARLQSALRSFRPEVPRIFFKPVANIQIGTLVQFSSTAKTQSIKTKMLTLPTQIRFKPVRYRWSIGQGGLPPKLSSLASPTFTPTIKGDGLANLALYYSVEYSFTGITAWTSVKPDILVNVPRVRFQVGSINTPETAQEPPRLVNKPCLKGYVAWRC